MFLTVWIWRKISSGLILSKLAVSFQTFFKDLFNGPGLCYVSLEKMKAESHVEDGMPSW